MNQYQTLLRWIASKEVCGASASCWINGMRVAGAETSNERGGVRRAFRLYSPALMQRAFQLLCPLAVITISKSRSNEACHGNKAI